MAGIRDVAKYAGVSPSTVSRVFSGVAYVEPETKQKVMDAVKALNYKPNLAARSLKRGESRLIGLIIPDIMNPYYPEVVKSMEICATKAGYSLILCDALGDVEKEKQYLKTLQYLFVDGILFLASTDDIEHVKPYIGQIPMVIINRRFDVDAPCINMDNVEAAYRALKYLFENGHRKVSIYMNGKKTQYNQERIEGCRRAFEEYKAGDLERCIVPDVTNQEEAYRKTRELFASNDKPTGIFMLNDFMAHGVYRGILKSGLHIPDDVSVVGFDDIPNAKYLEPPLTTVRHSLLDTSEEIFEKLRKQMKEKRCAPYSYTCYPGKLIIRESVRKIPV